MISAHSIGLMVRLRYKLMWARTRSRNGKIALFIAGYTLFVLLMVVVTKGGVSVGTLAVRSPRTELITAWVLSGLFIQALLGTIMLGFGLNAVFSDVELRRYPLNIWERRVSRHLVGIVDPWWLLILALDCGLGAGLCVVGGFNPVSMVAAVLLLFLTNYLAARVISQFIEGLVKLKGGSAFLMVFVMALALLPGLVVPNLSKNSDAIESLVMFLRWTPAFGAAAAIINTGNLALFGFAVMLIWLGALAGLLGYLEQRPIRSQTRQTGSIKWDSPYERFSRSFGRNAPLVAFWLRFYVRNNRFRALYCLSIPLVCLLTYQLRNGGRRAGIVAADPQRLFIAAMGAIFMVGFFGTSRMAVNQFGYVGGAFRRFFLLPTDPGASLRAGSYTSVFTGALLIPVALAVWTIFGGPFDWRKVVMLAGSALTGLFALHATGLWVTLYGPRKGNYSAAMGNDMSLMGNVVVIGGILCALIAPQIAFKVLPAAVSPDNWWIVVPVVAVAIGYYVISVRAAAILLPSKREELLAVVEGRTQR